MSRASVIVIGLVLVLISASLGVVWIALAARAWLATVTTPALAGLIVGAVLLLPLLVLVFIHAIASRTERRARLQAEAEARVQAHPAAQLSEHVRHLFRERPLLSAVLALATGAVAARHPRAAIGMVKLLSRSAR